MINKMFSIEPYRIDIYVTRMSFSYRNKFVSIFWLPYYSVAKVHVNIYFTNSITIYRS